ncbi:MAG: class I SAM-dependent methyltransferase [Oscillospiraceae bacterium]|nr:class I SAM-dependent methyltransferase [Oscillospiraceae bacterium]
MKDPAQTIRAAKEGFEHSFAEGTFYDRQTKNTDHLSQILRFLPLRRGMRILDLGTGTGFLAFPIAREHPDITVTGLDIVEQALDANRAAAEKDGLRNLQFVSYDGSVFPFADGSFDLVLSRYALHHFPEIRRSIAEVSRVLSHGGCFFLSDPAPNDNDTARFVDRFMQMKPDGHIRFYTKDDWQTVCEACGLHRMDFFDSSIRFPRKKTPEYDALLAQSDRSVLESYAVEVKGDEIYITEQVNNILFTKY